MQLFLLGTSHVVASSQVRELLQILREDVHAELTRLTGPGRVLAESMVLSTCARFEVYGVAADVGVACRRLRRRAAHALKLDLRVLSEQTYFSHGVNSIAHFFSVASGLDSVVQGEGQILGQVRSLLDDVDFRGTTGPRLHRLVQHAVSTGKRVRTETGIGRGTASLAGASLQMLERCTGGLRGSRVLVIGAGKTGTLVARLLRKKGVNDLAIANRTLGRARELAALTRGTAHAFDEIPRLLAGVDVVVGAIAAAEPAVTPGMMTTGDGRTRYFLDLSLPRSIDPGLADLPGVELLDLDAIHRKVAAARKERAAQIPLARTIVLEEAARYQAWFRTRQVIPAVRAVRDHLLSVAEREAERHARGLDPEQRVVLRRFARSLARTILHDPTMALRRADPDSPDGQALLAVAGTLFGVPLPDALMASDT